MGACRPEVIYSDGRVSPCETWNMQGPGAAKRLVAVKTSLLQDGSTKTQQQQGDMDDHEGFLSSRYDQLIVDPAELV